MTNEKFEIMCRYLYYLVVKHPDQILTQKLIDDCIEDIEGLASAMDVSAPIFLENDNGVLHLRIENFVGNIKTYVDARFE